IDKSALEKQLDTTIVFTSTRKNTGISELKKAIENFETLSEKPLFSNDISTYKNWLSDTYKIGFEEIADKQKQNVVKKEQHQETVKRYQFINSILKGNFEKDKLKATDFDSKLDKILTHK